MQNNGRLAMIGIAGFVAQVYFLTSYSSPVSLCLCVVIVVIGFSYRSNRRMSHVQELVDGQEIFDHFGSSSVPGAIANKS